MHIPQQLDRKMISNINLVCLKTFENITYQRHHHHHTYISYRTFTSGPRSPSTYTQLPQAYALSQLVEPSCWWTSCAAISIRGLHSRTFGPNGNLSTSINVVSIINYKISWNRRFAERSFADFATCECVYTCLTLYCMSSYKNLYWNALRYFCPVFDVTLLPGGMFSPTLHSPVMNIKHLCKLRPKCRVFYASNFISL